MASYGAAKERSAGRAKAGKFHHLEVHPAQEGGAVVHHFHEHPDGFGTREHGEAAAFGSDDGHKLAAHIAKHIGISMPGKAETESAEPEEAEEE